MKLKIKSILEYLLKKLEEDKKQCKSKVKDCNKEPQQPEWIIPYSYNDYGDSSQSAKQNWCKIAYWELQQRVGRLFSVTDDVVNIFQELPHGDGMCLNVMQQDSKSESIRRTREKIGYGLTLSREPGGAIWIYNRCKHPVFVNTPMLDVPNTRLFTVCKVLPGYSMKIFDYDASRIIERTRDPEYLDGPFDPNSIRISFAKGWGPSYSRQFITSCPCWVEILLSVNR